MKQAAPVETIGDLERLVCEKLHLVFEEVRSEEDLDRIIRKYVSLSVSTSSRRSRTTWTPTHLRPSFSAETSHAKPPTHYVAVIDCRGDKASRRFFTRWHEIAHLLTLVRQLEFPFHRSTNENRPLERLMDTVAGEVGFYEPIFMPVLKAELRTSKLLSFQAVEAIRSNFCGEASFQATLFAAVRRTPTPVIYVEAGLGYKRHEAAELRSSQLRLFQSDPPLAKLRVLKVVPNDAARKAGFRIDGNMQVPDDSVIGRYFGTAEAAAGLPATGIENLESWCHSDGTPVGAGLIQVEARAQVDQVVALIQPARNGRR